MPIVKPFVIPIHVGLVMYLVISFIALLRKLFFILDFNRSPASPWSSVDYNMGIPAGRCFRLVGWSPCHLHLATLVPYISTAGERKRHKYSKKSDPGQDRQLQKWVLSSSYSTYFSALNKTNQSLSHQLKSCRYSLSCPSFSNILGGSI